MSATRRGASPASDWPADAKELLASSAFPQLRAIADGPLLARSLGDALARGRPATPPLRRCTLRKLHYRPAHGCRLMIEARFGAGPGPGIRQIFFGRLLPGDLARREFDAPERFPLVPPRFGPARLFLPEWDLLLWAYPNDPELPGLALLTDSRRVRARLAETPAAFGLERPPHAITARRAKYVPGKRCGYVYVVAGGTPSRETGATRRIYGKCYAGGEAARVHDIAARIWASPERVAGRIHLPQPFACDEETGIVWQQGLSGPPLLKRRGQLERLAGRAGEIGARLAALHGSALGLPVEMTLAFQERLLRRSLAAAALLPRALARRAEAFGARLLDAAGRFDEPALATLHGSFRLSHVMTTHRGLAFIDLDGANSGDAACDLGRFVAHVLKLSALGSLAAGAARHVVRDFCAGYGAEAAAPVSDERIAWGAAVQLVTGGLDRAVKRRDASELEAVTLAAAGIWPA